MPLLDLGEVARVVFSDVTLLYLRRLHTIMSFHWYCCLFICSC